jgi:hypothetical protein
VDSSSLPSSVTSGFDLSFLAQPCAPCASPVALAQPPVATIVIAGTAPAAEAVKAHRAGVALGADREPNAISPHVHAAASVIATPETPAVHGAASPLRSALPRLAAQPDAAAGKEDRARLRAQASPPALPAVAGGPVNCPYCARSFRRRTNLNDHLRTHTRERPYKCSWPGCQAAFTQRSNCVRHFAAHRGERPFECRQCGRRFGRRYGLTRHVLKTHRAPAKAERATVAAQGDAALFAQPSPNADSAAR